MLLVINAVAQLNVLDAHSHQAWLPQEPLVSAHAILDFGKTMEFANVRIYFLFFKINFC